MTAKPEVLTIGHSTQPIEQFVALLQQHGVTAIADVRSQPFSRFSPQFNKHELAASLRASGIQYVFLGRELGARSSDPECYVDGRVQYGRLAESPEFQSGIARVVHGAEASRIALMCTEKDPLDCHRTVLVARRLEAEGVSVSHIRSDGALEPHSEAMDRLMKLLGLQDSLFSTREELIELALSQQEAKIAYVDPGLAEESRRAAS